MQLAGQVIEGLLWFFIAFMWVRFVTEWVQVFARSWSPRGVPEPRDAASRFSDAP